MPRFTADNTQGYDAAALAWLNERFEQIMADNADMAGHAERKSYEDHVAEQVCAEFDAMGA